MSGGEEPPLQTLLELSWFTQEELVECQCSHCLSREVEQKSSVYLMILTTLMEHPTLQLPYLNPCMCIVGSIFTLLGPSAVYTNTLCLAVYAMLPLGHWPCDSS